MAREADRSRESRQPSRRESGGKRPARRRRDVKRKPAKKLKTHWLRVEPAELGPEFVDHPWSFALYRETNRPDGKRFSALIFHDALYDVLGWLTWFDDKTPGDLRKVARRIVVDEEFRARHVSEEPRLRELVESRGSGAG